MSGGLPDGAGTRHFGVYPAIVTDLVDPDRLGRIEVKLPWLGDDGDRDARAWATLVSPYADDDQGLEILPEVDSQVVVAFEAGDLRRPYVLGATWNGKAALPVTATKPNNRRVLKSRSGSLIDLDDTAGAAKVTVSMASGHEVVLDDGAREVRVKHANGHSIVLDAGGRISITGTSSVDITAPILNVHAASAIFDGIITCTTILPSVGVVSPMYTQGAGNFW
jgi:uncharacterized protein involved in type VI secretion and phage assembly